MNRSALYIAVITAAVLTGTTLAEQDNKEQPLCLELNLVDGSCVIGNPAIKSIPVQTSYAIMEIPLKQILALKMGEDHETASLELLNGDKLKGVINLEPVKLDTVFGKTAIGIEHIKEIRVMLSGGELMRGLVLHYSFDRDKDNKVFDASGRRNDGTLAGDVKYEKTLVGMGIKTSSKDTYAICSSPDLNLNGWRKLTVSAWVKLDGYATYGCVAVRGKEGSIGAFEFNVGGVYGGSPYEGFFRLRLSEKQHPTLTVKRFAELNQWYHVAGVYDGKTLKYYVNGKETASLDVPEELLDSAIKEDPGTDLLVGKNAYLRSWLDTHIIGTIDNVMLFDRALNENEINQIYNTQK